MRFCLTALSLGTLVLPASAFAQGQAAPLPQPAAIKYDVRNGYSLAFVEADVRRVIDAVLGTMLEADYAVDPEVQGNITLRTNQPVTRESLVPLLESALRPIDAVMLVQGKSYRIVPREKARTRAPVSQAQSTVQSLETPSSSTPGYASEVITLKKGSAREIARLLEQFLGKEIVGGTSPAYNQVIITGTGEERQAARELIARFDVDALAGMNFEIYKLENVNADTLVGELERIFQSPYDILGSRVRMVPLSRLRSVLAIAADRNDLITIEPWIRRLDSGASGKRKLYSYTVQNGRARDLATSLQLVLGMSVSVMPEAPLGESLSATSLTSMTPISIDEGGASQEPSDAIAPQTPLPGASASMMGGTSNAGPRIVPNDSNNSLLIYADGEEYDFIREALEKLDQPSPQVLIEATLAEVTLTNDLRYGVNFSAVSGNTTITQSNSESPVPSSIFPGFSVSVIGNTVQGVLNTLQSKTNVRVLSAPKLIVLNNQTATLQVGDQVPVVTQQSQGVSAPGAPIINSVEMRDTGIILKVTPRVNERGVVTLDIAQEVSDVATTTTSGINSPTIQQRRLASTVATHSGQMIALGGLIRDRMTRTKSGVPLLSQIPVVGGLFGTQGNEGSRTELIILLTPTVIRSPDEVRSIVDTLIDGLDATRDMINRSTIAASQTSN